MRIEGDFDDRDEAKGMILTGEGLVTGYLQWNALIRDVLRFGHLISVDNCIADMDSERVKHQSNDSITVEKLRFPILRM